MEVTRWKRDGSVSMDGSRDDDSGCIRNSRYDGAAELTEAVSKSSASSSAETPSGRTGASANMLRWPKNEEDHNGRMTLMARPVKDQLLLCSGALRCNIVTKGNAMVG